MPTIFILNSDGFLDIVKVHVVTVVENTKGDMINSDTSKDITITGVITITTVVGGTIKIIGLFNFFFFYNPHPFPVALFQKFIV